MDSHATTIRHIPSAEVRDELAPQRFKGFLSARLKNFTSSMIVATGMLVFAHDVFAQERYYEWRWQMHPLWWGVWGIGMMLMMFLFWVLVVVGLIAAIRWLISKGKTPSRDSALEILRERYARGEINKEEFETRRKDLSA